MTDFSPQWTAAKNKAMKSSPPPELVMSLSQGADFGPALKAFAKADTPDKRSKTLLAVLKAKDVYEKDFKQAMKSAGSSKEKKCVEALLADLESIWRAVEKEGQPLRPSGVMVQYEVLRAYNLASGLKPKYLDVKATEVTVYVEIDKVLDSLIKEGKESLKLQHLGDVAKAELEKVRPLFIKTIEGIEAKISADMSLLNSKAKEANEVLKHYAKLIEDRVNKAVGDEWAKYQARAKHLSDFRFKTGLKVTLGVIGVGVATASLVLSFGTAWMNIFAITKGVTELVQTVTKASQGVEKIAKGLETGLREVDKLNKQREEARKKEQGQKASKGKEAAKELANALLPITKLMTKSTSTVEAEAKQLLGQVSKIEQAADEVVGRMNKAVKQLSSLPDASMNAKQLAKSKELSAAMDEFFGKVTAMHQEAQRYAVFGHHALDAAVQLKKSDSWSAGLTADASGLGTKATAVYALANFVHQCVVNGKSLIPL
ncbi:MAG: hypothetical protein JO006_14545 [Paucibacter sp.]|nr:hypothetical protein [Roseateles sp.]